MPFRTPARDIWLPIVLAFVAVLLGATIYAIGFREGRRFGVCEVALALERQGLLAKAGTEIKGNYIQ